MRKSPAAAAAVVAAACGMLLAAAGVARAERFEGVKYLGGVKGLGPRAGTLVVESGTLRFEDRKGREVFARSLGTATSWVGTEKRARLGRVLGGIALLPVGVAACGMGGGGNPWIGGTRKDSPIAMVKTGADSLPLRLRVPFAQLQQVVDAIRLEATKAAASETPAGAAVSETAVSEAPAAGTAVAETPSSH